MSWSGKWLICCREQQNEEHQKLQAFQIQHREGVTSITTETKAISTQVKKLAEGSHLNSEKLDNILRTVCHGQASTNQDLASVQQTLLAALQQMQLLQNELKHGVSTTSHSEHPGEKPSPKTEALCSDHMIMKVVDQQIIIRRNGKAVRVACPDEEYEKSTPHQKIIIVRLLLLSRLVAHLTERYGMLLTCDFGPFISKRDQSESYCLERRAGLIFSPLPMPEDPVAFLTVMSRQIRHTKRANARCRTLKVPMWTEKLSNVSSRDQC